MDKTRIEMIIAVSYHGGADVIEAPDEHMQHMVGSSCDDNNFKNTPEAPGIYRCVVDHQFTTTHDEGIAETDETFIVVSSTRMHLSAN